MTGRLFFSAMFILIFPHANVSAATDSTPTASSCLDARYEYKQFRPETAARLPFPSGAVIELKNCDDDPAARPNSDPSGGSSGPKEIEKQRAIKNLSALLSYIYDQQKNLAGSYRGTDQAYQELLKRNHPDAKAYDHAVSKYDDALKDYGEYEAYLSALPQAVSDYEQKAGSSFEDFPLRAVDGAITLNKSLAMTDPSNFKYRLKVNTEELLKREMGDNEPQDGKLAEQNKGKRDFCNFVGGFTGASAAENIVLASLANPMGTLLGVSLGATLCSENLYANLTQLPKRLGKGLMGMGSYVASGLKDIGNGLYDIGRTYLYSSPSGSSSKIAEQYESTKNWLNRKLGWN